MISRKAAGTMRPEAYCLAAKDRERSLGKARLGALGVGWVRRRNFQQTLQLADGTLEDGDLRHRIAGTLQLLPDLIFQVRGIADTIN